MLRSMPYLTGLLLKIYDAMGKNWERCGNVRFAVVYKPQDGEMDRAAAQERAEQIAAEWSRAMQEGRNGSVRDFVSVGDVSIRAIGADNQILDSETPVRQILEQLVAKTGLPPFLLGLSWSSTERMSALRWEETKWDKTSGMFRLCGQADYTAYFIAEAAEEETVFTDFVLKGTVKEHE